jgi:hypothetical protein
MTLEGGITPGTATGTVIKDTRCWFPRSSSRGWALPSEGVEAEGL